MDEQNRFLQELAEDLNSRNIRLPSFPDVVVNIRTVLEDPKCSAERLAEVVRTDPVLVARLLIAANSAFHNRAGIEIVDLDLAISRLGFEVVRNTAITLAVEQIFAASEQQDLKDALEKIWDSTLALASMSFVLAKNSGTVNADDAFLCGLLHEIGKLYILTKASTYPALLGNEESLATVMDNWHSSIGKSIVESWGFTAEIADSLEIEDYTVSDQGAPATLIDVVCLAHMLLESGVDAAEADECPSPLANKLRIAADSLPSIREAFNLHSESMRHSVGR